MSFAHKTRVGVLRGGPSAEYEMSLKTGGAVLANMPEEFEPLDIFISKDGEWHVMGLQKNPYDILKTIDVAVNAMHGAYGEDGTVQKILEHFNVPYTGSNSVASALAMNKKMTKEIFRNQGFKTPHHIIVNKNENNLVDKINESLPFPIILKPLSSGSSFGVSVVNKVSDIKEALEKSFEHSDDLLVEEFIEGKEAFCGVIEGFRDQKFYTLLPIGNFNIAEKAQIQKATALIHEALNLRHYSSFDFILHPKRGLFVLEADTLPPLSHSAPFMKSLEATGGNIREFLTHLISKTLENRY
jgi:D-alanine-D-alanine ligase